MTLPVRVRRRAELDIDEAYAWYESLFRSREHQAIVELALRQQLAVYARRHPRPRLSPLDRTFWIALCRLWLRWRKRPRSRSA